MIPSFTINNKYLWISAILALTCIVYIPVFTNGFTNWDDNIFVTSNELITLPFPGQMYEPGLPIHLWVSINHLCCSLLPLTIP